MFKPSLDDLPRPRDHLERLRHVLAELRQARAATGRARARRRDDDTLARQVLGERLPDRPLGLERGDAGGVGRSDLGGKVSALASASRSSSWSSICSSKRRLRSALAPYCSRLSFAICSFRCAMTASMALSRATALAARASASSARCSAAASSALSAPTSSGRGETAAAMRESESPPALGRKPIMPYPALVGRQLYCGLRQSIPSSRQASCEAVSDTTPSFAEGHTNRPFSSRFA